VRQDQLIPALACGQFTVNGCRSLHGHIHPRLKPIQNASRHRDQNTKQRGRQNGPKENNIGCYATNDPDQRNQASRANGYCEHPGMATGLVGLIHGQVPPTEFRGLVHRPVSYGPVPRHLSPTRQQGSLTAPAHQRDSLAGASGWRVGLRCRSHRPTPASVGKGAGDGFSDPGTNPTPT
jgi:hypothetical protein